MVAAISKVLSSSQRESEESPPLRQLASVERHFDRFPGDGHCSPYSGLRRNSLPLIGSRSAGSRHEPLGSAYSFAVFVSAGDTAVDGYIPCELYY